MVVNKMSSEAAATPAGFREHSSKLMASGTRTSHLEAVSQRMPVIGWIELALNVVPIRPPEARPRRHNIRRGRGIETIGHADPDDVRDQISIVKIIPEKHVESQPTPPSCSRQACAQRSLQAGCLWTLVMARTKPSHPVNLDQWRGCSASREFEEGYRVPVAGFVRIEVWIDHHHRVRVPEDQSKGRPICRKRPAEPKGWASRCPPRRCR